MTTPILADRAMETTTTTGTGTLTLAGAVSGYQAFSVVGDGSVTFYCVYAVDANGNPNGAWEVGQGTYTLSGTTLSRDTVLASSNSGSLVSFGAGTKRVILTVPAERLLPFVPSATNATILSDTFTGANGTNLTAHTMNVGSGWTADSGSWQIQSNKAECTTSGSVSIIHAVSPQADFTASVSITLPSTFWVTGLAFRIQDSSNLFAVFLLNSSAGGEDQRVRFSVFIGGVETQLYTSSNLGHTGGSTHTLQAVASGTSISVYCDGVLLTTATNANFRTLRGVGLWCYQDGTIQSATWDNFLVVGYNAPYLGDAGNLCFSVSLYDFSDGYGMAVASQVYVDFRSADHEHYLANTTVTASDQYTENVLAIHNLSSSHTSGIRFINPGTDRNAERGAVGVFNGEPFNGCFREGSNLDQVSAPRDIRDVLTGVINGSYGSYLRLRQAADGSYHFYNLVADAAPSGLSDWFSIDSHGNVVIGSAALATTATDGFIYVETCAGTPTGTPTSFTGRAPMVIDTTAGKLWIYYGGAWHYTVMV